MELHSFCILHVNHILLSFPENMGSYPFQKCLKVMKWLIVFFFIISSTIMMMQNAKTRRALHLLTGVFGIDLLTMSNYMQNTLHQSLMESNPHSKYYAPFLSYLQLRCHPNGSLNSISFSVLYFNNFCIVHLYFRVTKRQRLHEVYIVKSYQYIYDNLSYMDTYTLQKHVR